MSGKYGFDDVQWEAATTEGKEILAEYARKEHTISYSDFVQRLHTIAFEPTDTSLRYFLGEISTEEHSAGRGMGSNSSSLR